MRAPDGISGRRTRPIFVLGIDRSGTSLLAEVVARWGAYAGEPESLGDPDDGNPRGYWEHMPMQQLVAQLLQEAGSVEDPAFRGRIRQLAAAPEWRQPALALVGEIEAAGRPWLWKDPDLAFTLPFWQEICGPPLVLLTLRNPLDSARSYAKLQLPEELQKRVRLVAYFLLRWQHFMLWTIGEIARLEHKLVVSYEALVAAPRGQCARICRLLDRGCGAPAPHGPGQEAGIAEPAGPVPPETPEQQDRIEQMAAAVDPSLRRNAASLQLAECAEASAEQRSLYRYLSDRLEGDFQDFVPARFPLPPCGPEYLANIRTFRWLLANL